MNVKKWHTNFLVDLQQETNSKATLSCYGSCVLKFLRHFCYYREPKEIPNSLIKRYLLSFNTINTRKHNRCALGKFYKNTVGMPRKVAKIPYPKKQTKLPRIIDAESLASKIYAIKNVKHKCILAIGLSCGLRVSEVINLKRKDIDVKRMLIYINNAKGDKDRVVKLSPNLLNIIIEYGLIYRPKVYLFNGQNSLQYSQTSIQNIVKKYLDKNESYHLLRNTYATYAIDNGTELKPLSISMGHNSTKTVEQYYFHQSTRTLKTIKQAI